MCLLLLAMVPAWAADLPQEVTDAAPPAAEELEGKDFSGGIAALLEQGTTLLGEALRGNLRGAVLILGVVLLCGAADAVLRTPESPMRRFLPMAGAAAIAVLSLGSMKSLLGLTCDPVAGLVEVPCIKRNASGAVNAVVASQMALAGIRSAIPPDEVIDSMRRIGHLLPACLRETGQEGLAVTPTGLRIQKQMREA